MITYKNSLFKYLKLLTRDTVCTIQSTSQQNIVLISNTAYHKVLVLAIITWIKEMFSMPYRLKEHQTLSIDG